MADLRNTRGCVLNEHKRYTWSATRVDGTRASLLHSGVRPMCCSSFARSWNGSMCALRATHCGSHVLHPEIAASLISAERDDCLERRSRLVRRLWCVTQHPEVAAEPILIKQDSTVSQRHPSGQLSYRRARQGRLAFPRTRATPVPYFSAPSYLVLLSVHSTNCARRHQPKLCSRMG